MRQRLGLPVRQFAKRINVSAPHVTDIEADRRRPSYEVLTRIAEVLQIPITELEVLDRRLPPDVKGWIEERPAVGQLLRQLKDDPALLGKVEKLVGDAIKDKDESKEKT